MGSGHFVSLYEQLKKKLTEEGVFADRRNQSQYFQRKIGDFNEWYGCRYSRYSNNSCSTFSNRTIRVISNRVKSTCVPGLSLKLDLVEQSDADVVTIGRGGGSIEDSRALMRNLSLDVLLHSPNHFKCGAWNRHDLIQTLQLINVQRHQLPQQNFFSNPALKWDSFKIWEFNRSLANDDAFNQLNTRKEYYKLEKSGIFVKPERCMKFMHSKSINCD